MAGANKMKANRKAQCYDWVSILQTAREGKRLKEYRNYILVFENNKTFLHVSIPNMVSDSLNKASTASLVPPKLLQGY